MRGVIPAGQLTSEALLAKQFGVSRTPLREALRMLQHEGLVLAEPNRQLRIAEFSIADLKQLYATRVVLEALAMRATVAQMDVEQLAELEGLMAQMDHYLRAGHPEGLADAHAAFHRGLVAQAGPRVVRHLAELFDHAERYRRAYDASYPDSWPVRRIEHRAILDAVASGDVDLAVERLVAHYAHTAMRVISRLDPDHDPTLLRIAIEMVAPDALDPDYWQHALGRDARPASAVGDDAGSTAAGSRGAPCGP